MTFKNIFGEFIATKHTSLLLKCLETVCPVEILIIYFFNVLQLN